MSLRERPDDTLRHSFLASAQLVIFGQLDSPSAIPPGEMGPERQRMVPRNILYVLTKMRFAVQFEPQLLGGLDRSPVAIPATHPSLLHLLWTVNTVECLSSETSNIRTHIFFVKILVHSFFFKKNTVCSERVTKPAEIARQTAKSLLKEVEILQTAWWYNAQIRYNVPFLLLRTVTQLPVSNTHKFFF